MIPLNSRQALPSKAFGYLALRSMLAAVMLVLFGGLVQLLSALPSRCDGALCGVFSGHPFADILYLLGALVLTGVVLNYKWFSFLLTDKSISIDSGVVFRRSCTIRFDRIQDVDVLRNPLHLLLGLKSVAIWTASLDQRIANSSRPDGLIVLEADTADWLRDYLSDASANGGPTARSARFTPGAPSMRRRTSSGWVLLMVAVPILGLAVISFVRKTTVTVAGAPSAPASTVTAPAADATHPIAHSRPHHLRSEQLDSTPRRQATDFTIACTLQEQARVGDVLPCSHLSEGRRCEHEEDFPSHPTAQPEQLSVSNRSDRALKFYWLDGSGARSLYAAISPGGRSASRATGAHIG